MGSKLRFCSTVLLVGLLVVSTAAWAQDATSIQQESGKRVGPETATAGITPTGYYERQAELHRWLMSETPDGVLVNPVTISLDREELAEIDNVDPTVGGPLRVGFVKQLDQPVNLNCRPEITSRKTRSRRATPNCSGDGLVEMTDDGGFVWARSVHSASAAGIRVHVTDLALPADADLFFLSVEGEAYGPYNDRGPNGDGDFWLPSVLAETGIVVVRHYGPDGAADLGKISMTINEVAHIGMGFYGAQAGPEGDRSHCSYNASCIDNATCQSTGPAAAAEGAAAKMLWVAGCCVNICTGGLIADTDNSSETAYFLTANHCISKNNAASNLEAFFDYQVSCGTSNCVGSFSAPSAPKTTGSSIVATSRNGDFTLLELDQFPPSGSTYLGWNSTPIAGNSGAALHRISHPSGAPQAYSEHAVNTSSGTCQGAPRGQFIYSDDIDGATEGGSSGAPVVNNSSEIVGQLTGCCGTNCGNVCASASNRTIDGAFAYYFSSVESFLDPAGCTVTTASCSDGVDNDCDGATDCNDTNGAEDCSAAAECQSSGCTNPGGADPGASCSSNGDCCSNKCKGPPNNKSCR